MLTDKDFFFWLAECARQEAGEDGRHGGDHSTVGATKSAACQKERKSWSWK